MAETSLHLTCAILCLMCVSLGACLGYVIFAIIKAAIDHEEKINRRLDHRGDQ